jgi:hypothetical protein
VNAGKRASAGLIALVLAGSPSLVYEHDGDHHGASAASELSQLEPQVLASERSSGWPADWQALVVAVAVTAMACVAAAVIEHRRRRSRRSARKRR